VNEDTDDDVVPRPLRNQDPVELTPSEFEVFVVDMFRTLGPDVVNLDIQLHEQITAADGTYDFDATVRFEQAGLHFLVLVEAKRHVNAIKRDIVMLINGKLQSVGAQKGVVASTAPFQAGALTYARKHGIALVHVSSAGPTYVVRQLVSAAATESDSDPVDPIPLATAWELTSSGALRGTLLADGRALLECLTGR
jgi:restriction system protein